MKCRVDGCDRNIYIVRSQLCSRHYSRLRTTGTTDDGPKARATFEQRFWRNVQRGKVNECWPWKGKSNIRGYGVLGRGNRNEGKVLAHRASWEIHHKQVLDKSDGREAIVLHTCDTPGCVNPKHLRLGTQSDNMRDMVQKKRMHRNQPEGENHGNAIFTEKDVRYIKRSKKSNAELAREFDVNRANIWYIRNKGWLSVN